MNISQDTLDRLLAPDVSPAAFRTALIILSRHPDEYELAYLTADDIAGFADVHPKTAARHISECLTAGILVVRHQDEDGACYGPPTAPNDDSWDDG